MKIIAWKRKNGARNPLFWAGVGLVGVGVGLLLTNGVKNGDSVGGGGDGCHTIAAADDDEGNFAKRLARRKDS